MTAKQAKVARKTADWIEANSDWQSSLENICLEFAVCVAEANKSRMMLWLMKSKKIEWMTGGYGFSRWLRDHQHRRMGIAEWTLTRSKLDSMDIDIEEIPKILRGVADEVESRERKNLIMSVEIENIITESLDLEIWLDISCIPMSSSGIDLSKPPVEFKKYKNIRSSHSDTETWILADKIAAKIAETQNGECVFVGHFKRSQTAKPYQDRILDV